MYRPWINRKFGVELEMNRVSTDNTVIDDVMLKTAIRDGLTRANVPLSRLNREAPSYRHSDGSTWDVKTDASCGGPNGGTGWEIAAPALTLNDEAENIELMEVTNAVKALRPRIDRTCGLHVHVEVRDYTHTDLRNLIILWARYEPFFFQLCPPSRRRNSYCPPTRKTEWDGNDGAHWTRIEAAMSRGTTERDVRNLSDAFPRGSLNLYHFWASRRVEFRLAAGTIEYTKIVRWVQLLLSLVQRVKHPAMAAPRVGGWANEPWNNATTAVTYQFKVLGLAPCKAVPVAEIPPESRRLQEWAVARIAQFAEPTAPQSDGTVANDTRPIMNARGRTV